MDRRVTLIVFLSFWCLSHQQGRYLTLCRGDRSVLAQCGASRTPFPGQLPPGWGRTCQAGTTQCDLTDESTVESTQYYREYQCDSETWNLTYLCLPADQTVDICQDVRQTREGDTSLVHGQLMAPRDDNVTCKCVVTRSPGPIGVPTKLYTRHLVQTPAAEAASCQGRLTLRDTVKAGPTLCLLTTRPTGQYSSEVSLWPGYAPYLNETNSLTITSELDGGATWRQDQLLSFALRLSGTKSYDIECGRLDNDVTESTGIAVPTTTTAVVTNREFEATSVDNPGISTTSPADGGKEPVNSAAGIIIGHSVALALVVVLVIVTGVFCLLRRRHRTPGKPSQSDGHDNSVNGERHMHSLGNVSGVECQGGGSRGSDVTMDTSGVYETVRDRDLADAIQHRGVHQSKSQGHDGPDRDYIEPYSVTMNQPTRHLSSTELALQDNPLYR